MQGWLNSEVGDLIKTVRSYRRETQSPKSLPQLPAPPCLESNPNITKDNTKELKEISAKLTSLATEVHYLQKDRSQTRQERVTSPSPEPNPENDLLKSSLVSLREEMEASRKEISLSTGG
ncbi:hypothetical protein ABMA28_003531 [Loxostege sticticalis]|uniref:Uncharacterized protein n=1 Tax=Loxostege sticticalis TaxID=481309 RepID=A0ABD0SWD5_LOXSC